MARSRPGHSRRPSEVLAERRTVDGTGGFLGQIGLFETGNGLPVGPVEIAIAIVAAVLIYPVTRLIRMVRGR